MISPRVGARVVSAETGEIMFYPIRKRAYFLASQKAIQLHLNFGQMRHLDF